MQAWFSLVNNVIAKYGIVESDIYNFDETGFMMGIISTGMVVTSTERLTRRWFNLAIGNGLQSFKASIRKTGRCRHSS